MFSPKETTEHLIENKLESEQNCLQLKKVYLEGGEMDEEGQNNDYSDNQYQRPAAGQINGRKR